MIHFPNKNQKELFDKSPEISSVFATQVGRPIPAMGLMDWGRFYGMKILTWMIRWVPGMGDFMNKKLSLKLSQKMITLFGKRDEYIHAF